jgi:hypothetical protein
LHGIIKKSQIEKIFLRKKNNAAGITILYLKLYYRAIVTKTEYYYHRTSQIYQ